MANRDMVKKYLDTLADPLEESAHLFEKVQSKSLMFFSVNVCCCHICGG